MLLEPRGKKICILGDLLVLPFVRKREINRCQDRVVELGYGPLVAGSNIQAQTTLKKDNNKAEK